MGLFKKKKFPKYVKGAPDIPHLPTYESQVEEHEFAKPNELPKPKLPKLSKFKMPKPAPFEKTGYGAFPEEDLDELDMPPTRMPEKFELRHPEERHHEEEHERSFVHEKSYTSLPHVGGSEPIYVKIEDYKRALKSIALINDKLNEAEDLLADMMDLKKEEDGQISGWHKEIAEIKSKLMEVHKGLFEVGR